MRIVCDVGANWSAFNPLNSKINLNLRYLEIISYRAVNTLRLGYENQTVNAV
jgi:hypothetical protein